MSSIVFRLFNDEYAVIAVGKLADSPVNTLWQAWGSCAHFQDTGQVSAFLWQQFVQIFDGGCHTGRCLALSILMLPEEGLP